MERRDFSKQYLAKALTSTERYELWLRFFELETETGNGPLGPAVATDAQWNRLLGELTAGFTPTQHAKFTKLLKEMFSTSAKIRAAKLAELRDEAARGERPNPTLPPDSVLHTVPKSPRLHVIVIELRDRHLLLPGLLDPRAYTPDHAAISAAWKRAKSRMHAVAKGISVVFPFFEEIRDNARKHGDLLVSPRTMQAKERWEEAVRRRFGQDAERVLSDGEALGQYLEYRTRAALGLGPLRPSDH